MLTQSDEEDIIMVFDQTGTPLASITHGLGIDEPLQVTSHMSQDTSYYYTTDALGSITALTDSNANIIEQYQYSSFGELTILNSQGQTIPASTLNPLFPHYTYTAREHDPETNLYFYRARYYDAEVGRFTREDPILRLFESKNQFFYVVPFLVFEPRSFNPYIYALSNPVAKTDPMGLDSEGCDMVPNILETGCIRTCCNTHDRCYKENTCTAKSWCPEASSNCSSCNRDVVVCTIICFATGRGPGGPVSGPPVTWPPWGI